MVSAHFPWANKDKRHKKLDNSGKQIHIGCPLNIFLSRKRAGHLKLKGLLFFSF